MAKIVKKKKQNEKETPCTRCFVQFRLLLGKNTSDRTNLVGLIHETRDNKDYNPDYQAPANQSTPRSCAPDDFVCADGTCIPETHHCDHFYDCRDFTDEQYCFGQIIGQTLMICWRPSLFASFYFCYTLWFNSTSIVKLNSIQISQHLSKQLLKFLDN